jgi:hypothetical protein
MKICICSNTSVQTDFTQYEFLPEAVTYATNEMTGGEVFGASYFESVFHKLADSK